VSQVALKGLFARQVCTSKPVKDHPKRLTLLPQSKMRRILESLGWKVRSSGDVIRAISTSFARINPTFSLDDYKRATLAMYKNKADVQRYMEALRKV